MDVISLERLGVPQPNTNVLITQPTAQKLVAYTGDLRVVPSRYLSSTDNYVEKCTYSMKDRWMFEGLFERDFMKRKNYHGNILTAIYEKFCSFIIIEWSKQFIHLKKGT